MKFVKLMRRDEPVWVNLALVSIMTADRDGGARLVITGVSDERTIYVRETIAEIVELAGAPTASS